MFNQAIHHNPSNNFSFIKQSKTHCETIKKQSILNWSILNFQYSKPLRIIVHQPTNHMLTNCYNETWANAKPIAKQTTSSRLHMTFKWIRNIDICEQAHKLENISNYHSLLKQFILVFGIRFKTNNLYYIDKQLIKHSEAIHYYLKKSIMFNQAIHHTLSSSN